MVLGNVFDIKRFAVHDGPGIRTTLFLKGCPLSCRWCHNPEGKSFRIELHHFFKKCLDCGYCLSSCPNHSLTRSAPKRINIDKALCSNMGQCVNICPSGALQFVGRKISVEEAVEELMKDKVFFERSGGGITLSGGDPLGQPKFAFEILKLCHQQGLHTAIETALFTTRETLEQLIPVTDLFLVDLKLFDDHEHMVWTGVSNQSIKKNIRFLQKSNVPIIHRVPLIPGVTALNENVEGICQFISEESRNNPIEFLNYNPLAGSKYSQMGLNDSQFKEWKPLGNEELGKFQQIAEKYDLEVIREESL
nr:glycyl-radical enzyme activating protein [uncultured Sphaerochaeta sp.]